MPLTPRSLSGLNGQSGGEEAATLTAPSPSVEEGESVVVVLPPPKRPSAFRRLIDRLPLRLAATATLIIVVITLLLLSVLLAVFIPDFAATRNKEYQERLVADINTSPNVSWKAVYNKFAKKAGKIGEDAARSEIAQQMPGFKSWIYLDAEAGNYSITHAAVLSALKEPLPPSLDARLRWPQCYSVHQIFNQGGCGSCYATVAASVISDRICIHSDGDQQPIMSIEEIITCCADYGKCNSNGCGGGVGLDGFLMWRDVGLVTGGPFGSIDGCKPYGHNSACGAPCAESTYIASRTGQCVRKCADTYPKKYEDDKFFS